MKYARILGPAFAAAMAALRNPPSTKREQPKEQRINVQKPTDTGLFPRATLRRRQRAAQRAEYEQLGKYIRTVPTDEREVVRARRLERRNLPLSKINVSVR